MKKQTVDEFLNNHQCDKDLKVREHITFEFHCDCGYYRKMNVWRDTTASELEKEHEIIQRSQNQNKSMPEKKTKQQRINDLAWELADAIRKERSLDEDLEDALQEALNSLASEDEPKEETEPEEE